MQIEKPVKELKKTDRFLSVGFILFKHKRFNLQ